MFFDNQFRVFQITSASNKNLSSKLEFLKLYSNQSLRSSKVKETGVASVHISISV